MSRALLACLASAVALPNRHFIVPDEARLGTEAWPCTNPYCKKPTLPHEAILPVAPRLQWDNDGGYCGSMAIQNVALAKGVWLSQQQVRDATVNGGGHDHEILATNIELALTTLKLQHEGFDYKKEPVPQADAYRRWLKKQLTAGHGVAWMIMLHGGSYPVYPGLPYGFYSHVEPVLGVMSSRPLSDPEWHDDDIIVHGTDASRFSYYRRFDSLPANITAHNNSLCAEDYLAYPCIYEKYGFGWAVQGVVDKAQPHGLPVSLEVDSVDEPDTSVGRKPKPLIGTLTISGLSPGGLFEVWRWDSFATAFNYSAGAVVHDFNASSTGLTWVDPKAILSSSATYYRVLPAGDKQ